MIGMREILVNFANLTKSDIVGMRAPFLKPGRNTQYEVFNVFILFMYIYIYTIDFPLMEYIKSFKIIH